MLAAVIVCMLFCLFALLLTIGSILAKTGFAKWWGSVAAGAFAVTASLAVLTLANNKPAPAPIDGSVQTSQAQGQEKQLAAATENPADLSASAQPSVSSVASVPPDSAGSQVSSVSTDSMDEVQTGQLLASVLQALKNGQSIGDEFLNQLPAGERDNVRAVLSTQ